MQDLSDIDLIRVCGGAQSWDAYVKAQRVTLAPVYKQVVCAGVGVKGGVPFAEKVYGKANTTDADRIRAANTMRGICLGGDHLPAAAPANPF